MHSSSRIDQLNRYTRTFVVLFLASILTACSTPEFSMPTDNNPLPKCPESPNCVRTQIEVDVDPSKALKLSLGILDDMKAHSVDVESDSSKIDAVFKIPVFGFLDDVQIQVDGNDEKSTIFIRSASRVGYSDLGVNNRRVGKFIRLLKQELSE